MNIISFQSVYQTTTSPQVDIGQVACTPDGREWVYVKATTGVLAKGSVAIPIAVVDVDTVSSSTDSQGRIVYITEASAGWTVGAYAGGTVYVNQGTGVGQWAKILTNTADTLVLAPETALTTALAVADSDILIYNNFQVQKAAVTSKIQNAVGIAQVAFANLDFGWLLTKGQGVVLAGEVLTVGGSFVTGDDTTGQVLKGTTAKGEFDEQTLGRVLGANDAADQNADVWVHII
jgi:hypothetical protein